MEKSKVKAKRKKLLETLSILLIISGSLFDLLDIKLNLTYDQWSNTHYALKDAQMLGACLLCFSLCGYDNIKIKAFTFMLVIWRALVLPANILADSPVLWSVVPVYSVYLFWIFRTLTIEDYAPVYTQPVYLKFIDSHIRTFNVLLPISTFRGLLQALFTFANPKYETRLLVHKDKIYSVQNNKFVQQPYNEDVIQDLLEKAGAKIKLVGMPDQRKIDKVFGLIGKRSFTGIRDCRRLEV